MLLDGAQSKSRRTPRHRGTAVDETSSLEAGPLSRCAFWVPDELIGTRRIGLDAGYLSLGSELIPSPSKFYCTTPRQAKSVKHPDPPSWLLARIYMEMPLQPPSWLPAPPRYTASFPPLRHRVLTAEAPRLARSNEMGVLENGNGGSVTLRLSSATAPKKKNPQSSIFSALSVKLTTSSTKCISPVSSSVRSNLSFSQRPRCNLVSPVQYSLTDC
jgi:hypothetical protein